MCEHVRACVWCKVREETMVAVLSEAHQTDQLDNRLDEETL